MKKALIDYVQRGKNDEIYTPKYAIEPLMKYLPKNKIIWECTDYGKSQITQVLSEGGYKVISTHKDNFNFLTDKADFNFDMIITNPPYSLKDDFLKRCYEYKKPFCLLLPITALEGKARGQMFRENGIEVLVLDGRVQFQFMENMIKDYNKTKSGNWFNTSWFCWNVLKDKLIFEKLVKE